MFCCSTGTYCLYSQVQGGKTEIEFFNLLLQHDYEEMREIF